MTLIKKDFINNITENCKMILIINVIIILKVSLIINKIIIIYKSEETKATYPKTWGKTWGKEC